MCVCVCMSGMSCEVLTHSQQVCSEIIVHISIVSGHSSCPLHVRPSLLHPTLVSHQCGEIHESIMVVGIDTGRRGGAGRRKIRHSRATALSNSLQAFHECYFSLFQSSLVPTSGKGEMRLINKLASGARREDLP